MLQTNSNSEEICRSKRCVVRHRDSVGITEQPQRGFIFGRSTPVKSTTGRRYGVFYLHNALPHHAVLESKWRRIIGFLRQLLVRERVKKIDQVFFVLGGQHQSS